MESPKTTSIPDQDAKPKTPPHLKSSVRLALKDLKGARVMLSITCLFKGYCNLNQMIAGQTWCLCCNKAALPLTYALWILDLGKAFFSFNRKDQHRSPSHRRENIHCLAPGLLILLSFVVVCSAETLINLAFCKSSYWLTYTG